MADRMTDADAVAWLKANPNASWADGARATGHTTSSLRGACEREGYAKPPKQSKAATQHSRPAHARTRVGVSATTLAPDDRQRLVDYARDVQETIGTVMREWREDPGRIDKDTANAMRALTGSVRDLVSAFPDLLVEVERDEGATKALDREAELLAGAMDD